MSGLVRRSLMAAAKRRAAQATDPHFANVLLLLDMEGSDGGTVLVDHSPLAASVVMEGNAATDTDRKQIGAASLLLPNGGGSAYVGTNGALGVTNSTTEAWVYPTDFNDYHGIVTAHNGGGGEWIFGLAPGGSPTIYGSNAAYNTDSRTLTLNAWTHLAAVVENGRLRFCINGVRGSDLGAVNCNTVSSAGMAVGRQGFNTDAYRFAGSIDEVRVTKNVARYTADFTPSLDPFPHQ